MAHLDWKRELDKEHTWWQHNCKGVPRYTQGKWKGNLRIVRIDGSDTCRSCGVHRDEVNVYGFPPDENRPKEKKNKELRIDPEKMKIGQKPKACGKYHNRFYHCKECEK